MSRLLMCTILALFLTACSGGEAPKTGTEPGKPETKTEAPKTEKKTDAVHPWAKFNVGSSSKMKTSVTTTVAGKPMSTSTTMKQTLLEKTADKAIVEIETSVMGTSTKTKTEIPLATTGNPALANVTNPANLKEGSEDVTVGGKTLKCKWVEFESSQNGSTVSSKVWTSEDVPGMMVKSVTKVTGNVPTETTTELVEFEAK